MFISRFFSRYYIVLTALILSSCTTTRIYRSSVVTGNDYHSRYDDTTLTVDNRSILMPYNRFIDPAGTTLRFGNPSLENHSLDCVLLPGGKVLAVEDRYGLAFFDVTEPKLLFHLDYKGTYKGLMSTYSGLKVLEQDNMVHIFWGTSDPNAKKSLVLEAAWDGKKAELVNSITFDALAPAPLALPNDIAIAREDNEIYLYVVLNGNNQLSKLRLSDKKVIWTTPTGMAPFGLALTSSKAYVTNWAGPYPTDSTRETAGIPYGNVYTDPRTGATAWGSVSIIDRKTGKAEKEIETGLHPNAVIVSNDGQFAYVANGNSDDISVINIPEGKVTETIPVKLNRETHASLIGDSPNALALDQAGTTLYVSNGMDNAIAVVRLGSRSSMSGKGTSEVTGFIPTGAYPAGMVVTDKVIFVSNLEGEGVRVATNKNFSIHQQEATTSIIPLPEAKTLKAYTARVEAANMLFRMKITYLLPRKGVAPKPVPERIGEPSVFRHVVYIIKENKTYDQVLGDVPAGNGAESLCIFGNEVTPNQHKIAKDFLLMDNYYASGKSSAEGHSWVNAAIVTDYIEKSVRAWFRSYPHVLYDAMVYSKEGFIWNNALDHGKTVRVYGEACIPAVKEGLDWTKIYQSYLDGKPVEMPNTTTISRLRPILSPTYPGFEGLKITDQIRADAFINELHDFENKPGDQLPNLMVLALPADHTIGTREGYPTPRAMVADNDLALGKILQALTESRFWDSTVVFVTQDDPQSGWDHVSAYRTTGFVVSPYSRLKKTIHTNYNQTCMVRTIEQILGIPPMNVIDATALPMFDCFGATPDRSPYSFVKNNIPLDEMNKRTSSLQGQAKRYSRLSSLPEFDGIDNGRDDLLNRIQWFASMGNKPYPKQMTLPGKEDEKDKD